MNKAYQIEHGYLHHALVEIGRSVLDDLDGHHLLSLQILALDDLAKRTLAQNIEDEIAVPTKKNGQLFGSILGEQRSTHLWPASSEPKISFT